MASWRLPGWLRRWLRYWLRPEYLPYSVCVLFLLLFAIGAASLLFTASQVSSVRASQEQTDQNTVALAAAEAGLQRQIRANCQDYLSLAGIPVKFFPDGRPSELAIRIVSNSRMSWRTHECPGKLPPPDPSFVAGARLYGVPVN